MSRQGWPTNLKGIYTHNAAAMFLSSAKHWFTGSLRMSGGTIFKVGSTSARQKSRKCLWFELATVTSQALKYDVIKFCQHV